MKKVILIILGVFLFFGSFGQKYEAWFSTSNNQSVNRVNIAFFTDTTLTVYTNPTWFTLSKDNSYRWDDINSLKIRNKSKHQIGTLAGMAVGMGLASLIIKGERDGKYDNPFGPLFGALGVYGASFIAGHLITSAKITIPINGKSAKEKSKLLRNSITKNS